MAVTKEEVAQIQGMWAEMKRYMEEREAERKANDGQFRTEIQSSIDTINARWNEMETKGKRPGGSHLRVVRGGEDEETKVAKVAAFENYMRKGFLRMQREQRELLIGAGLEDIAALEVKAAELKAEFKSFSIADDTLGGYFVIPEIVQNEVIKSSVLFSPVRDLAKVQQTSNSRVEIPVRKGTLSAQWTSETSVRTETLGQKYGKAVIPTEEMFAFVLFSRQLLEDEFFDLQAELTADIAEQFGVAEGASFVTGDGVGKPQGFLANVATNVQTAAGASAIAYADLVKVFHKLKPAYRNSPNCKWVFNQNTLSAIRQIVDGNSRPIFQPYAESGLSNANPGTILGKTYVEAVDMPDIATGIRTVAVGDFSRAYRFVDRVQMTAQRLEELYAASGQVGLLVHKRVGGQLVLEEAVAVLKQA